MPVPSWPVAYTVTAGYILLLFGIDSVAPTGVLRPAFAPVAALGGVLGYWLCRCTVERGDPRIWRDPVRFGERVRVLAAATGRPLPDDAHVGMLLTEARRTGGIALAQQGGMVAGAGAGVSLLDRGGFPAIVAFGVTMVVVGLTLRRWLVGRD